MSDSGIKFREAKVWKLFAALLGFILLGCLFINLHTPATIPTQLTSFLFGFLICMGVGYTVVSPESSPVMLTEEAERKIRRQHYAAGLVMSILFAGMLLIPELRAEPSSWILVPIIFLAPVLVVREIIIARQQRKTPREQDRAGQ